MIRESFPAIMKTYHSCYTCFIKTYLGVGSRVSSYFTSVPTHFHVMIYTFEKQNSCFHCGQEKEWFVSRMLESKNDTTGSLAIWIARDSQQRRGAWSNTAQAKPRVFQHPSGRAPPAVFALVRTPRIRLLRSCCKRNAWICCFPKYPLFGWCGYFPSPILKNLET